MFVKQNKNTTLFVSLLCIVFPLYSQSSWSPELYKQYNIENFRSFEAFHKVIDIENFDFRLANAAVFYVTNEIRKEKKRSILHYHPYLEAGAYFHSKDMAKNRYFSHYNMKNKNRADPQKRASLAGIANPYAAENITEGFVLDYITNKDVYPRGKGKFSYTEKGELLQPYTYIMLAETLLDLWMHSPPHKKNILSKDNQQLGCGVSLYIEEKFNDMPKVKATQLFQQYELIKKGKIVDAF